MFHAAAPVTVHFWFAVAVNSNRGRAVASNLIKTWRRSDSVELRRIRAGVCVELWGYWTIWRVGGRTYSQLFEVNDSAIAAMIHSLSVRHDAARTDCQCCGRAAKVNSELWTRARLPRTGHLRTTATHPESLYVVSGADDIALSDWKRCGFTATQLTEAILAATPPLLA